MGELSLAYSARTYSSGTPGRALCNARHHHWVADDSGGEAVGAGEMFCASIAACAVNMVERLGRENNRPVGRMQVEVSAFRDMAKNSDGDVTLYDAVRVDFAFEDTGEDDAAFLVKTWKER